MRVMMLSWEYPPRIVGGISPHVQDLSQALVRLGVEVHVVTKATHLAPDEETDRGVCIHRVHLDEEPHDFIHQIWLLNLATERRVRQLLEDWRPGGQPTIFHAHDWLSLDSARELKYEYKLPMIATVHATEEGRHGGIRTDTSRYIHEQEYWLTYEGWRIIVCSDFMRREVVRTFNVPWDKVDVIYNGVFPEKFQFEWDEPAKAKRRLEFAQPDEKIVMYVGRFVREKGIHVLLNAANVVLAKEPKTKFVLVGKGDHERPQRFASWTGLGDRVHFAGFQSGRALHEIFRLADVSCFPSLYEPFGIVALEAMAAGSPVVAADAGGLAEVVLHERTGTLSYANDPQSLAWAILRVLQNPAHAQSLTQNAQTRLKTDFDWDVLARQTLAVYDRVWSEFLDSYWAAGTVWPVSPGAAERASALRLAERTTEAKTPPPTAAPTERRRKLRKQASEA